MHKHTRAFTVFMKCSSSATAATLSTCIYVCVCNMRRSIYDVLLSGYIRVKRRTAWSIIIVNGREREKKNNTNTQNDILQVSDSYTRCLLFAPSFQSYCHVNPDFPLHRHRCIILWHTMFTFILSTFPVRCCLTVGWYTNESWIIAKV